MASGMFRPFTTSYSLDDIKALADASNLGLALMQSSYSYNKDHEDMADVSANECDRASYARILDAAAGTVTYDAANDRAYLGITDDTWSGLEAGNTISGVIVYDDTNAADADKKIIAWIEFTVAQPTGGGDLTADFDPESLRCAA